MKLTTFISISLRFFMIDTIKISYKLPVSKINSIKNSFDVCKTLHRGEFGDWFSEKYFMNKSFQYTFHEKNDLVNFDYITVDGSLSKQIKGDNYQNHKYLKEDVSEFYDILEKDIGFSFSEEDIVFISRFDTGINLLNVQAGNVIPSVMSLSPSRMSKHLWDGVFRVGNKTRQLRIYDKSKEILEKQKPLSGDLKKFLKENSITRIETQIVRSRNIVEKHKINSISDLLDIDNQKKVFFDTYRKIINSGKIKEMQKENYSLTLKEYRELQELKTVIKDFGDLEVYRKHLLKKGFDKGNVSRSISRLRNLIQFLEKDALSSLDKRIEEEIKKLVGK